MKKASLDQGLLVLQKVRDFRGTTEGMNALLEGQGASGNFVTFLQGNLQDVDPKELWRVCNPGFTTVLTSSHFRVAVRGQIAELVAAGAIDDGWCHIPFVNTPGGAWVFTRLELFKPPRPMGAAQLNDFLYRRRRCPEDKIEAFIGVLRDYLDTSERGGHKPPSQDLTIVAPGCAFGPKMPAATVTTGRHVTLTTASVPEPDFVWPEHVRVLCRAPDWNTAWPE